MKQIVCCECEMPFSIADETYDRLRETRRLFYCPGGHAQHFLGETEAQIVRRQNVNLTALCKEKTDRISRLLAQLRATRAWVTRLQRERERSR